ncbi:MAG TPA: alpha-ketoglutarate-dependent dioxygenase AlkB, partial [Polyangiaceae bacterium]|nr:alpha-ketoglutarate-dependent dioxygenase AlkB [Polyangiaceae bacterium]
MPAAATERPLELGGSLRFHPAWLDRAEADALFSELRTSLPWTQGTITLFGRERAEPRLTAWFGDADYTYSGRTLKAAPWPAPVEVLRRRAERETGVAFNFVLLNRYRDGGDSMGMHSDDEPELGTDPVIASVSLGATRRFV